MHALYESLFTYMSRVCLLFFAAYTSIRGLIPHPAGALSASFRSFCSMIGPVSQYIGGFPIPPPFSKGATPAWSELIVPRPTSVDDSSGVGLE